ncbi:MAG: sensor histidine kinase, partial [Methanomicrobiales archaeon]
GRRGAGAGGRRELIAILSDVTQRKKAEQALTRATEKLDLLNQITRHDILNHIMVLQGYLDLLRSDAPLNEETAEYLDRASKSAEQIEEQIAFTRDYQRLGMSPSQWQDIESPVRDCISMEVHRDDIEVVVDLPAVEIFADPMLDRVFCNLFQNAVRHGGGITRLAVRGRVQDGDLSIIVEDDGCGIDPGEKENLFEPSIGRHHGHGLYLISEILAITGISITEVGAPGVGARFVITVPEECWRWKEEGRP